MFRTMLVDDDFLVRSYLKTLKAWEKAGYEIVADVRDGEEAEAVLSKTAVDVLITDISMPVMNGIELIRSIKEKNLQLYIIVLSCHDDFEYVKEAMKLGADEYILKNALDEESLLGVLEKTGKQIIQKKESGWQKAYTEKLIRMGSHTLKYYFFNGLISGILSEEEREKKRLEAGIHGKFMNSAVINMFIHNWREINQQWTSLEAEEYTQSFRYALRNSIEEALGEDSVYVELVYLGAGVFCCFLDMSSMCRSSVMRQWIMNVALLCLRHCKEEPYDFGIGVSNICFGENGIRQAYQQVREMMKLSFYEDSDILYFDCQKAISSKLPEMADVLERRMEIIKNSRNKEEISRRLFEVLKEAENIRTDGRILIQWFKSLDKKAGIERSTDVYMNVWNIEQMKEIAAGYAEEMFSEIREIPQELSQTVRRAVEFVHKNYKKQVGLQDAAEAAGVNAAYLSYLFKQEMNIGFSNYLQERRMERVKELLDTSNYKIKEIAKEAGFQDYHYFSKLFKKLYGCSPVDYRKRKV